MGSYASENFKTLLLLKISQKFWNVFMNFSPNGRHKIMLRIFEILNFRFLTNFFFENFKFTIVPYGEIKNLKYLENDGWYSKTEWNLGLAGSYST